MKPKALVVEDDHRIIESIEDTLFSIGHEHDWATNQQDARRLLKEGEYDYVLLDLQIPAKPNRVPRTRSSAAICSRTSSGSKAAGGRR